MFPDIFRKSNALELEKTALIVEASSWKFKMAASPHALVNRFCMHLMHEANKWGLFAVSRAQQPVLIRNVVRTNNSHWQATTSGGSRIFPGGGSQLPKVLLFFNFLPKTAWKWKNLDPQGGHASLVPPLGSANDYFECISLLRCCKWCWTASLEISVLACWVMVHLGQPSCELLTVFNFSFFFFLFLQWQEPSSPHKQ